MLFESWQISLFFPLEKSSFASETSSLEQLFTHIKGEGVLHKQNNKNTWFCLSYLAKEEEKKDHSQNMLYPALAGS